MEGGSREVMKRARPSVDKRTSGWALCHQRGVATATRKSGRGREGEGEGTFWAGGCDYSCNLHRNCSGLELILALHEIIEACVHNDARHVALEKGEKRVVQ